MTGRKAGGKPPAAAPKQDGDAAMPPAATVDGLTAEQLAEREKQLRLLAQTAPHHSGELGSYDPNKAPPGYLYIDRATEMIATRLACPEGPAVNVLLAVLQAGDLRAWERGFGTESIVRAQWAGAHIDLGGFRANHRGGIRFEGRVYHLHHFVNSEADLAFWLGKQDSRASSAVLSPAATLAAWPLGLPVSGSLMTACELLTWLAFGKPAKREAFPEHPLGSRMFARWQTSQLDGLLTVLVARASPEPFCPFGRKHLYSPAGPPFLRGLRAQFRREQGRLVTYAELAAMLRADLDALAPVGWQLVDATIDLLGALRAQRIVAFVADGHGAPTPIPFTMFLHPAITVTVFDQVQVDGALPITEWPHLPELPIEGVTFLADDVARSGLVPIPHRPKREGKWLSAYDALCWVRFRAFPEHAEHGSDFDEARAELRAKFRDGLVPAQGRPDLPRNMPNPDAGHVDLDPNDLTQDAIKLPQCDRIGPNPVQVWDNPGPLLPSYSDVRFDRETVMRLWPAPDPNPVMERATEWMRSHADPASGRRPKREDALKACNQAGFSVSTCRKAWAALPPEWRRRQGQH